MHKKTKKEMSTIVGFEILRIKAIKIIIIIIVLLYLEGFKAFHPETHKHLTFPMSFPSVLRVKCVDSS